MHVLNRFEKITFGMICEAANAGLPCPSNLDIEMELGCNSTSIPPNVISSLERKGLIVVIRYQRAREIMITETGKATCPHPQRRTNRKHVPRGSHTGQPA